MTLYRLTILPAALTLAFACSGDGTDIDDPGPGGDCTAGETAQCICDSGGTGERSCQASGTFGACESCTDPDPGPVSFQNDVVPIFEGSCGAGITGCHAREAFAANEPMNCRGWLSLENTALGSVIYAGDRQGESTGCPDMPLFDRLMVLAPWQCAPDSQYIAPGDLANSYIIDKINGTDLCGLGNGELSEPMPPADSGLVLSAQDRATLEQWVLDGAPNN